MNTEHRPSLARRERTALVETFREVGPDARTLCQGWTTRDLAAHLVVREGRPDAAAGILVPAFAGRLEELRLKEVERPWEELLGRIDLGAPWYSPLRYADQIANAAEYLVHHEDVLRAREDWDQRSFDTADLDRVWALATMVVRTQLRRVECRVELRTPGGVRLEKGKAVSTGGRMTPVAVVNAAPVELLMWAFGRDECRVDVSGDRTAVDAVRGVSRGL